MKNIAFPIHAFRDQIVEAVRNNSVVVITAETGAGKSTQVPQYLLDEGYDLVITQPRRLAARTVAERVAEEIGEEIGGTVGYRTAVDRQDSPATRCLFCTDGLALVRELMGANKGILVLDEVHEWNENMEVLVAWAKRQIESGTDFKVVLMSATLEAEKLAAFFNGVPVITVPGRLFPVEVKQSGARLVDDVATLVAQGRNVLVFQPGKQEIEDTCAALKQMQVSAEILPLHGQLTPEEQSRCFKHYGLPKVVVSTNVAQTSVTIDDIDAVVDSGMERRIELVDGVEGLYLKPISYADSTQRKGRAGRTKPGIYIDHCGASSRPDFPVAEIMRKRLDQTVLRLAIAGFDMEKLAFFHQPNIEDIHDARRTLVGLGCMNADGSVTRIGKLVNRLPVSVKYARMLVEADRLGVMDDVLTVAAIMEQGGITVPPPSRNQPDRPDWRRMVPSESESDVIGHLAVWQMAENMTKDEMREKGVSLRSFFRAKEIRQHLAQAVKRFFQFGSTGRREDILKAVCAGMVDHLYKGSYGRYTNGEGIERELGTASLVRGAEWLVGKPFDLEIKTRRGTVTLKLIELGSKVDPMWLTEIAPQLVERKAGLNPRYDTEKGTVVSTTEVNFNGVKVREEVVTDPDHPEATRVTVEHLYSSFSYPALSSVAIVDEIEVPAITEVVVGRHPETGKMLVAYGVYHKESWYDRLVGSWARSRAEAEEIQARMASEVQLVIARKRQDARLAAEEAARVKEEEEKRARQKEIAARAEAEVADGTASTDFGGHFRRMGNSGNGDFWVVAADGTLREPDEVEYRKRYTSEGQKKWRFVLSGELALAWQGDPRCPSCGAFEVVHLPVGGLTDAQISAVRQIEETDLLALPGSFGLDPKLAEIHREVENSVSEALGTLRGKLWRESDYPPELKYGGLRGGGVCFASAEGVLQARHDGESDTQYSNRDAWIVHRKQVTGHGERWTLEVLLFYWGGDWNLAARLVEPAEISEPDKKSGIPASADALTALARKFGR